MKLTIKTNDGTPFRDVPHGLPFFYAGNVHVRTGDNTAYELREEGAPLFSSWGGMGDVLVKLPKAIRVEF